jgi:hypothetical protein
VNMNALGWKMASKLRKNAIGVVAMNPKGDAARFRRVGTAHAGVAWQKAAWAMPTLPKLVRRSVKLRSLFGVTA